MSGDTANPLPGGDWRSDAPPLAPVEIENACRIIGKALPSELIELYRQCNGGEGSLPYQPWNFVLDAIELVAELRQHEHYRENYPEFVFFGSNGAGELFGLDSVGRVFFMDGVAGEESIIVVAESFKDFLSHIGIRSKE